MIAKKFQLLIATVCTFFMPVTFAAECAYAPGRFIPLGDAVVYDSQTDLSWQICSFGVQWSKDSGCNPDDIALLGLEDLQAAIAHMKGWRLPTLDELHSIVLRGCEPAVDASVFPGLVNLGDGIPYWTSTRAVFPMPMNFFVDFTDGSVDMHSLGFPLAARLVRDGRSQ